MSILRTETLSTLDDSVRVNIAELISKALLKASDASSLIGYIQSGENAILQTIQQRLRNQVYVTDFGAEGDGETDDSESFQAAHDQLPSDGGVIVIPGGRFWRVESTIKITKPVTIMGSGSSPSTLMRSTNLSSNFFHFDAESSSLQNLRIIGVGAQTSTSGTFAVTTTTNASRFYVSNVQILNVNSGISLLSNLFSVAHTEIRNINSPSGVGIEIDQSGVSDGVGLISSTVIQNADDDEPYAGVNFKHAIGILVSDSQFMQCGHSVVMAPLSGKSVSSVKFVNVYFDTSNDGGLLISNSGGGYVQRITVGDSWLSSCKNGSGLRIVTGSSVDGIRIADSEFYDSLNGIQVDDSVTLQNLEVEACVFAGNTEADISMGNGASNWSVRNCRSGTSGGFGKSENGLYINSNCSNFMVTNNDLHEITDSSYPSSNVIIRNNLGWGFGSVVIDPASLTNGSGQTSTCACTGARKGDMVECSFSNALLGVTLSAWVSDEDVVSFRFQNGTGGTVDLGSGTIKVQVSRVS